MSKLRPSTRFVGQEKYLMGLRNFFAPENSLPAWNHFLLYGMGGVGKTQICLKFIEELLTND
jgi:Holliday junction resolvasome RuvABC ATP-dependent DNA helicase subunit